MRMFSSEFIDLVQLIIHCASFTGSPVHSSVHEEIPHNNTSDLIKEDEIKNKKTAVDCSSYRARSLVMPLVFSLSCTLRHFPLLRNTI